MLWMINIRMRRVEEIERAKRCDRDKEPKCYQGPNRSYMLHDSQVFARRHAALDALQAELQKIYDDREAKQQKLMAEIRAVAEDIHETF